MTIYIYYDDIGEPERIPAVRGIAPDNEHDRVIIWYTRNGENCFLNLRYTDYVRIVII